MCGICGVWGQVDQPVVQAMVDHMRHRGPDDQGVFFCPAGALGMARLAIIDLSAAGHQPMSNPARSVWIVFNGEMYNFQAERRLLEAQGETFASHTDTEVVLKLYERYGDDFLLRLRGMFALAILDLRRGSGRERLLLARDPLGIKPLLYAWAGRRLLFASELKALLASGLVQAEIDPEALRLLLTYGSVYQPRTLLRGVLALRPAHRLILEGGRARVERYWTFGLDRRAGLRARPYAEQVEAVADELRESVRLQMVSDVPIGAFLSGGIDSSLLVGLMTRLAGEQVKTFSVGFEAEGASLDETDEANQSARFFGADHRRIVVTSGDVRERLEHFICGLDQPSVDGLNSYFVSWAARQRVTVAISGTGGDELFAGYPWFAQAASFQAEAAQAPQLAAAAERRARLAAWPGWDRYLAGRWGPRLKQARGEGFLARYAGTYQIFGAAGAAALLAPGWHAAAGLGRAPAADIGHMDELSRGAAVERVSALCLRGYTGNQLLRDIDACSMAHSLEVRVPFLDVSLLDLSLSLPPESKLGPPANGSNPYQASYRASGSKRILIDAGKHLGVLPEAIDQQPKRGFSFPVDHWLKGALRGVIDDTLSPEAVQRRGLLRPEAVAEVRQRFLDGQVHWTQPWLLMVLELWCRALVDRRA
jgi:asparagine synthase (glutamine-hydrolysing)